MDDLLFIDTVKSERSIAKVIHKMGRAAVGSNYRWVHNNIKRLKLDTSHWVKGLQTIRTHTNESLFVEDSDVARSTIRKRIIRDNLIPYICNECEISHWKGKKLGLVLDHINGVRNDHRLENLRFLCPNCNSLTDTFAGRNKTSTSPNCIDCGIDINYGSKRCTICSANHRSIINPKNL